MFLLPYYELMAVVAGVCVCVLNQQMLQLRTYTNFNRYWIPQLKKKRWPRNT